MRPETLHTLERVSVAIIGQTVMLVSGWAFLGSVFVYNPLIVPDYFAHFMQTKPTETICVCTLIATALAIATTAYGFVQFSCDMPLHRLTTQFFVHRFQRSTKASYAQSDLISAPQWWDRFG